MVAHADLSCALMERVCWLVKESAFRLTGPIFETIDAISPQSSGLGEGFSFLRINLFPALVVRHTHVHPLVRGVTAAVNGDEADTILERRQFPRARFSRAYRNEGRHRNFLSYSVIGCIAIPKSLSLTALAILHTGVPERLIENATQ